MSNNKQLDASIALARRLISLMPESHQSEMNYLQVAIVINTMWNNGYHIVHPTVEHVTMQGDTIVTEHISI
jgi:hypothetical protein